MSVPSVRREDARPMTRMVLPERTRDPDRGPTCWDRRRLRRQRLGSAHVWRCSRTDGASRCPHPPPLVLHAPYARMAWSHPPRTLCGQARPTRTGQPVRQTIRAPGGNTGSSAVTNGVPSTAVARTPIPCVAQVLPSAHEERRTSGTTPRRLRPGPPRPSRRRDHHHRLRSTQRAPHPSPCHPVAFLGRDRGAVPRSRRPRLAAGPTTP